MIQLLLLMNHPVHLLAIWVGLALGLLVLFDLVYSLNMDPYQHPGFHNRHRFGYLRFENAKIYNVVKCSEFNDPWSTVHGYQLGSRKPNIIGVNACRPINCANPTTLDDSVVKIQLYSLGSWTNLSTRWSVEKCIALCFFGLILGLGGRWLVVWRGQFSFRIG